MDYHSVFVINTIVSICWKVRIQSWLLLPKNFNFRPCKRHLHLKQLHAQMVHVLNNVFSPGACPATVADDESLLMALCHFLVKNFIL